MVILQKPFFFCLVNFQGLYKMGTISLLLLQVKQIYRISTILDLKCWFFSYVGLFSYFVEELPQDKIYISICTLAEYDVRFRYFCKWSEIFFHIGNSDFGQAKLSDTFKSWVYTYMMKMWCLFELVMIFCMEKWMVKVIIPVFLN